MTHTGEHPTTGAGNIDFLSAGMIENPYPTLATLRQEEPISWNDRHMSWVVTRYDDVREVLKRGDLSVELGDEFLAQVPDTHPLHRFIRRWMVFSDPPDHTRLRGLVARAFTPGVIARLETTVETIVEDLCGRMETNGSGDFMEDFAGPLPALVIADLFGLPFEDREQIGSWSNAISAVVHRELGRERFMAGAHAMEAFAEYLSARIAELRKTPGEDLLSRLVSAREEGDLLSEEELISTVMLFLFAGHETTTSLLGNALVSLTTEAHGLTSFSTDDPGSSVEELMRFDGPGRLLVRHVKEDCEIAGTPISAGQRVFASIAAANRDPTMFDYPDTLQLDREPNRHLGFGVGLHFCLGANLARLETRVSLATLRRKFPGFIADIQSMHWRPVMLSRCLKTLPYRL